MTEETAKIIRHALTRLLARREHGYLELIEKLKRKGFTENDIVPTLDQFRAADLQSDARFAESFVRNSVTKGHGKRRIVGELNRIGVNESDIHQALAEQTVDWFALALEVKCKRFGNDVAEDMKMRAKQQRFLAYRGFYQEEINHAITYRD